MARDQPMMDALGIHWAGIDRIIIVPVFILLIALCIKNYRRIKDSIKHLAHPQNLATIFKNFSLRKLFLKTLLLTIGICFLFLALLQPQWGKKEQIIKQEGRDVVIILDISRSMLAKDMKPTRLDFAKLKIRTLLSKLTCERVGLIVFSGSAFVQCPLTIDSAAFLTFLQNVDTEIISSGTTSLDKALTKALEVFEPATGRKNKLVILLTDGEDYSLNLNAAQSNAIKENLHVFALGIGTPEGAPIPKLDESGNSAGHETDEKGNIVLSALNEKLLQELCTQLHGHYVRATYDDSDADAVTALITGYEKESFEDRKLSLFEDQYPWFLGIAWFCLALEWIL
jgi:Ca-activated chloride channel homolog